MAPHSSTLAWTIPWTAEPGRLQSMGSLRVGHGWVTSLSLFTFMHWRKKWQPTPVFLPGKSHGQRSLVGYSPWGHRVRNDLATKQQQHSFIIKLAVLMHTLNKKCLGEYAILQKFSLFYFNHLRKYSIPLN